jgi:hypothetical protein
MYISEDARRSENIVDKRSSCPFDSEEQLLLIVFGIVVLWIVVVGYLTFDKIKQARQRPR